MRNTVLVCANFSSNSQLTTASTDCQLTRKNFSIPSTIRRKPLFSMRRL